ncbi:MAG: aldehyde dehydrogenase family protein, partial [Desulfosporosinus sp.]
IQCVEEPSVELSQELMRSVDLVVATGGSAMVHAAYSSGKPAYGVGVGNAVMIIAEDADIKDAAKKVHLSKVFDNATSCSSENSIIVHEHIYKELIDELKDLGGYLCSDKEKYSLEKWMWQPDKSGNFILNAKIVGQPAKRIATDAGIIIPDTVDMLMVIGGQPDQSDRFSGEKLSPVLTIWKYSEIDEAISYVKSLTSYSGRGHSCGIYTFNDEYIRKVSERINTSRIMVRQPMAPANGGNFFNGMPTTATLGCGTWGGNITTENINYRHMLNITWVSEPIKPNQPSDKDMWGKYWEKYGK